MNSYYTHFWISLLLSGGAALLPSYAVAEDFDQDGGAIVIDFSTQPQKPAPAAPVKTPVPPPAKAPAAKTAASIIPPTDNDMEFLPLLSYITSEDNDDLPPEVVAKLNALPGKPQETDAAANNASASLTPETFEWKGSLMFPVDSIRTLNEMMKVYDAVSRGVMAPPGATGTVTMSAPVTPSFFVNSIMYRSPTDWIVWINGEKINTANKDAGRSFTLEHISKDTVAISWKTTELDLIFPLWKQYFIIDEADGKQYNSVDGRIHIAIDTNYSAPITTDDNKTMTLVDSKAPVKPKKAPPPVATVTAKMHSYQRFVTKTMEIIEGPDPGGTTSTAAAIPVDPAAADPVMDASAGTPPDADPTPAPLQVQ